MSKIDVHPRIEGVDPVPAAVAAPTGAVAAGSQSLTGAIDARTMMIIGIVIVVVLVLMAITYFVFFREPKPPKAADEKQNNAPPPDGGTAGQPAASTTAAAQPASATPAAAPATSPAPQIGTPPAVKTAVDLAKISADARAPPPNTKTDEDIAAMMETVPTGAAEQPADAQ